MNKKNNRKGFTTVELVIVIAVIAILATVLIPTFSNLIGKAEESAALQEASSIFKSYTIENATTFSDETIYIKVTDENNNATWFKAENGQLSDKVLTAAEATALNCGDLQIRGSVSADTTEDVQKGFVVITPDHIDNPKDGTCDTCGKTGLPTT